MSADMTDPKPNNAASQVSERKSGASEPSSGQPPTGAPKKFMVGQTVCNERNEKGKLCNGHLKQLRTGGEEAKEHLRGSDALYQCQTCGALYAGPPLGHLRDPQKQSRFVQKELAAILQAAGGTLPVFTKPAAGAPKTAATSSAPAQMNRPEPEGLSPTEGKKS